MDEIKACLICGSKKWYGLLKAKDRLGLSEHAFQFVRCCFCGLVFQNPRVNPQDIGIFYPNNYFQSRNLDENKNKIKSRIIADNVKKVGSLIEIGSANGDFLFHMKKNGWYVEGVEQSYAAAQNTLKNFNIKNIHCGDVIDREDNGIRFDVAVLWGVLPHIHNPIQTIGYISNVLNKSGKLIITCANIDSIPFKIMEDQWGHLDLPRHYCMYNINSLRMLLESNGMYIEKVIFHDNLWSSNINIFKLRPFSFLFKNMFYNRLIHKAQKRILNLINLLLTYPLLLISRLIKKGGIITVISKKY